MKSFALKTFGCQMNKDDSERIAGLLVADGYLEVPDVSDADIVIFNTCCVRQTADDRAYGQLSALKRLKAERPGLLIAIGGCLAQKDGETILQTHPHVDVVFGTHNLAHLPALLAEARKTGDPACEVLEGTTDFAAELPAERRHDWHAWLPITVGCDNFCSYCIVPHVRGREKSRTIESLVEAAHRLVDDGVQEITLLGQNVNSYGRDLFGVPAFAELLGRISDVSELRRVRFTTSHPKDLTPGTVDIIAERDNLCPHIHLPLQAGSDRVLAKMRRRYTSAHYLGLVGLIRERIPDVAITTDIMVGFPGETAQDFERTLEVVEEAQFDYAFTFIYSTRPGTAAAGYEDPVSREEKQRWFSRLIETQNRISLGRHQELLGRRFDVFVEGRSKKERHRLAARTASNKLLHLDGPDEYIGQTLPTVVTEAFSWFLIGEEAT